MSIHDHYARESVRLRTIIEALAYVEPHMQLEVAAPLIFEIEKETFDRETLQLPGREVPLNDFAPETLAQLIDICPKVRDEIPLRKINAIKELRALTNAGLKEAKEGVEHWASTRGTAKGYPAPSAPKSSSPADMADWIDTEPSILRMIDDGLAGVIGHGKIQVIKEVRALSSQGLKESKEGVEEWLRTRRPHAVWPVV